MSRFFRASKYSLSTVVGLATFSSVGIFSIYNSPFTFCQEAEEPKGEQNRKFKYVIVGGGSAGVGVAAQLKTKGINGVIFIILNFMFCKPFEINYFKFSPQ